MGSVPAFSRSGAGETQLFPFGIMDSATSGFRPLKFFSFPSITFFDPCVFTFFQGAAAAAAGRGSPPPPGARRASVVGLLRALAPLVGHDEVKRARGAGG